MTKPASRSTLLARELLGRIARRELRAGDPIDLPALGRRHGVSRTVVREALADLGGKGLVVARPKVGTTIAPEAEWNLLDPSLIAVAIAETGPESMLAEATALRRIIEPPMAAAAAREASRGQRLAVLEAVRALAGALGRADAQAWADADLALYDAIGEACANRLLRSVDHALVPVRALYRQRLLAADSAIDGPHSTIAVRLTAQAALGLAIARGQTEEAHARALSLIGLPPVCDSNGADLAVSAPAARQPLPALVSEADEEWPSTQTLLRPDLPLVPVRRAHLELNTGLGLPDTATVGARA
jgi:DNA-binding FadR family transcriptional regulator